MRFAVDAHAIGRRQTGNEVYIRNLLHHFPRLDGENTFSAFYSQSEAANEIPPGIEKVKVSANPYVRLGIDLPRWTQREKPAALHVQYTGPLFKHGPVIASVHDVSFLECAHFFTRYRATQLRLTVQRTIESAAKIITVSEFSRRAILRHYPVSPNKVITIPNGAADCFRPMDRDQAKQTLAARCGIRQPFVLMVGDLQPRKNHLGLLKAFEQTIRKHPKLKHQLVLVGKRTWHAPEVLRAVARSTVSDRVHFAGFIPDEDLLLYYAASDFTVYPSFYEGFGLPIIEAMACGRAVACSNTTAMPEVANGAALLFDPHSVKNMAASIEALVLDTDLRQRLELRGIRRAKLFSWERSARLTLDAYYEVAGISRRLADEDRVLLPTATG